MAAGYWEGIPFNNSSTPLIGEEDGDSSSSDNDLIIDTVDSSYEGSKASTPTTPSSKATPTNIKRDLAPPTSVVLGENDFKGLTFVGKMDVIEPPDIICLYSYHWGTTHVDIITRNNEDTVVPMTNVYGRIIPGLTRNAVSNRIPKLGAKTIALTEGHINVLKKLQLPITARSHYLSINDFINICVYYKRIPPSNLANFAHVTSRSNPVDILKMFNSQIVIATQSSSPPLSLSSSLSTDFTPLSPGKINASLALTMSNHNTSEPAGEAKFLLFKNGRQLSVIHQEGNYYILNAELHVLLPQANQNVIGPLRSLLNIPLEYASRTAMNALKDAGVISVKACRIIIYKISDVIKMYNHWTVPIPQYIIDLSHGKFPEGILDSSSILPPSPVTKAPPLAPPLTKSPKTPSFTSPLISTKVPSLNLIKTPPLAPPPTVNRAPPPPPPSNAHLMSPSGAKVDLYGEAKHKKRKNSHSSPSPLSDQDLDYNSLMWSEGKCITLLTPPSGEPYIAIAELVDKVFSQRSQISLQRRTRLGIPTIPATSLQIHALRARGSIDPSSGYSKLVPLSGVIKLVKEAAMYVPPNVLKECQKYISADKLKESLSSPSKTSPFKKPDITVQATPLPPPSLPPSSLFDRPPISIKSNVINHPDVIMPVGEEFRTAEGGLYQVLWGKEKIVIFTSARNISYVGLYQIYDSLFKHLVTRMNFKMRMRKLGIKSIRAPSFIRQGLIRLDALPSSSPVCGLLRISEMERLVKSYDTKPPKVFYDLFLNDSAGESEDFIGDEFKNFATTAAIPIIPHDRLIVSLPRVLLNRIPLPSSSGVATPNLTTPTPKSSVLQNLAKKISLKNHRLAKSITSNSTGGGGTRNCYSCGKTYSSTKKRCEDCGIFLVGRPCHLCNAINYSLCTKCVQCGALLDRGGGGGGGGGSIVSSGGKSQEMAAQGSQEVKREEKSDSSEEEGESPTSSTTPFSAPPIRTAVLKSMFPEQAKNAGGSGGVVTKTIFSGNITSSRNCQECGALNSRKAKKCRQCRAPVQGRPCPQCTRPNHSHSTECFKCGATLPFTASKWVIGGRIYRSSNDSGRLGMTNKQFKKAGEDRAAVTCIRCHRVRQYGRFKCGRCGDLYSATPVYEMATPPTGGTKTTNNKISQNSTQTNDNNKDLLQLVQNLVLLGVGEELLPTLSEKEEELRKQLYPAEEELEAAEEEYHKFTVEKSTKESHEISLQVELDVLILEIEKLNKQLETLEREETAASETMEVCPDQVKELEAKLNAYTDLHED